MSVRKLTAGLLTVLAMLGGVARASAQEHFNNLPPADPFAFDPDFRWFEPVYDLDLADMKAKHRAPSGWFATYDRLHLYGSRPETDNPQDAETKLDSGWGHRYELGYMTPKDQGWTFTWTNNSVSAGFFVRREQANRYDGGDVINGSGDSGASDQFFGFPTPPGEGNNLGTSYRWFDVGDTENVMDFNSYELNKTWRLEPYHYGGILEPLVGVRWMRLNDTNRAIRLNSFANVTSPGTLIGDSPFSGDQLLTSQSITDNEMLGGQIGFRYFKYRDRFTFSTDFRVFSGANWQSSKTNTEELVVLYDGPPVTVGDPPLSIQRTATLPSYERNEEAFVGFDIRGELGYQMTKMLSVRAGFQVIDIGTGVWRGGSAANNLFGGDQDQDLVMVGGTFGLTLNH